jgi:filamentous hemagglutinin family protein
MKVPSYLLALFVLTGLFVNAKKSQAQTYQPSNRLPIADNTLGTTVIRNTDNFAITGGLSRGQNTFHSFQDFSVPTNGVATFANPVGNQSIITRVTGNLFSDINGTINTQGANFLLINPNGVVFGPGTQLNVGRVFAASTANGVDLVDGAGRTLSFGTNTSGDGALLSIDPKVIFNVSRLNLGGGSGEIKNFGTLQTNNSNQYIGLVGGNVTIDAGKINAPGGRVESGGLLAPGSVEVSTDSVTPRLKFPDGVDRSNVTLNNQARVNVAGGGGGNIAIDAHNIDLLGDSDIRAGLEKQSGSPDAIAGNIDLKATGKVLIDNGFISNNARANSQGKGGNINIQANSVSVSKKGNVQTFSSGQGNAGNVNLNVAETVDITDKSSGIISFVDKQATGNAGNIGIEAGSLSVRNKASIFSVSDGQGNSGSVVIKTKGSTSLIGGDISANLEDGTGKAGDVNINAASLLLQSGATISASSFSRGDAGNISVVTQGAVSLQGQDTNISSRIERGSVGKGGNIDINAGSVSLTDGAQLILDSSGQGDGGKVLILATNNVDFVGKNTAIFTTTGAETIGNGGDIDIRSATLSITDGAELLSSSSGRGNAGNINVQVTGTVNIVGRNAGPEASIISDLRASGVGNAGNINIDAGLFFLKDGAQLQSSVLGRGDAGSVRINAKNTVSLSGKSAILSIVGTGGIGKSGNIDINSATLVITETSQVSASSNGTGDAGNISIQTMGNFFLDGVNSQIRSTVINQALGNSGIVRGNAGNIQIQADSLLLRNGAALITSNRGQGNGGIVTIAAKDIRLTGVGTSIISSVESGGIGKGGDLNIQANTLILDDGASFSAFNSGLGDSGNIKVKATGVVEITGAEIGNFIINQGNAGDIFVEANSLSLRNGASFLAANLGEGNAGKITLKANDYIFLSGLGKNIFRGLVVASDKKGIAGDITVLAPRITLDKGFSINALSNSGNGGNISIGSIPITNLILVRNGSEISTNAEGANQQSSNGGNIKVSSGLIVAIPQENSDITANAFQGRGGRVEVTTQGLFGTQFRSKQTSSSDITASSSFGQNGTVTINTPGIDPGKDTSKLPIRPIDASKQITQRCSATQEGSQFYVTGRGGHPSNTNELLHNDVVWLDPRNPGTQSIAKNPIIQQTQKSPQPAVGWSFNGQGKVTLLAASNQGAVNSSKLACPNTIAHLSQ